MKRLLAAVEIALDLANAYHQTQKPKKPRIAADVVLVFLAGLLGITAVGFALAAAYLAIASVLSQAVAALLTGVIALGTGLIALLVSRLIMRPAEN